MSRNRRVHVNFLFLLFTLIPAAAVAGGVYLLHGRQMTRSARFMKERAAVFAKAGEIDDAKQNYRYYLGYEPEDAEATADYALLLRDTATKPREKLDAFFTLERALRLDDSRADLRRAAIDLALDPTLVRYGDAKYHLVALLEKQPADAELEDLLGQSLEGMTIYRDPLKRTSLKPRAATEGTETDDEAKPNSARKSNEDPSLTDPASASSETDAETETADLETLPADRRETTRSDLYPGAEEAYRKSIAHDPTRVETYVRLARLLRETLEEPDDADRVMDAHNVADGLVAMNPTSGRAFLRRAVYRRANEIEGSADDLTRALELAPADAEVQLEAMNQALADRKIDEARGHLEKARALIPDDIRVVLAAAQFEREAGNLALARADIEKAADEVSDDDPQARFQLRWSLINLQIDEGLYKEAREEIAKLRADSLGGPLLEYLEGRILVGERRWAKAIETLKDTRVRLRDQTEILYQIDLLLAACYEQIRDTDGRLSSYRSAIALNPQPLNARLGLAATLAEQGQLDEAISQYGTLVNEVPGVALVLARLLMARTLSQPEDQRDWGPVDLALDAAAKALPEADEVPITRAQSFQLRGQPDKARAAITEALALRPDSTTLRSVLAGMLGAGDPAQALRELDTLQQKEGDTAAVRLARIGTLVRIGGESAKTGLDRMAEGLEAFSADDRARVLLGLFAARTALGDQAAARTILDRLVAEQPDNPRVLAIRYEVSLAGQDAAAKQAARQALIDHLEKPADADTAPGIELLIQVFDVALGKGNDLDLARQVAALISEVEGPEGAYARVGKARLAMREANENPAKAKAKFAEGRSLLEEAAQRRPRWYLVPMTLGSLEAQAGDREAAAAAYELARQLGVRSNELYLALFRLYSSMGRMAQADALLEEMAQMGLDTADTRVARLEIEGQIRRGASPAEVLDAARKAIPADSKEFGDHLWLGTLYQAADQPDMAQAEIKKAIELAPTDAAPRIALVRLLAVQKKTDEAAAALSEIETQVAADQRPLALAQAHAALGDLDAAMAAIEAGMTSRPGDSAFMRNAAAFGLLAGRTTEAETYLRKLAEQADKAPDDAAWASRTLAPLLAASAPAARRVEARKMVGLPEKAADFKLEAQTTPAERRAQAQVLALDPEREWNDLAVQILERLIDREAAGNPNDEALLAQLYQKQQKPDEALQRMERLIETQPDNVQFLTTYLGWLMVPSPAQPEPDVARAGPALARLKKLAPDALPTAELEARALIAKGQKEAGIQRLTAYAESHPENRLQVAALIEGLGSPAQAETLYRRAVDEMPDDPRMLLVLGGYLERQGPARQKEAEVVYRRFGEKAKAAQPEAPLALAAYYGRVKRLDEALNQVMETLPNLPRPVLASDVVLQAMAASNPTPAQLDRTAEVLEAIRQKAPDEAGLLFQLANLRTFQQRYDEAERFYRQSLERAPENDGPWNNLAWLLALKEPSKADEAIKLANDAVDRFGFTPELRDTRAVVNLKLGKPLDAIRDLEPLAVNPARARPIWLFHLSQAYLDSGQADKARATFAQAVKGGLTDGDIQPLEMPAYDRVKKAVGSP